MVVVDASIVYKWLVEEEHSPTALTLLELFITGKEKLIAPDLLLYELANIFTHKTSLSARDIQLSWNKFLSFKLPIFNPDPQFITKCIDFAQKYHVSVYDASYAILAKQNRCILVTADSRFIAQTKLPFIKDPQGFKLNPDD